MEAVKEIIVQNKGLCILFLAVLALTVFMMIKADKAVKRNNAEKESLIKKLDHLKMLRENYSELTEEKIFSDESGYLLEGTASNIQLFLESTDDMNAVFEQLCDEKKIVYAANYFIEDGTENASKFFREYSKPLSPWAVEAVRLFAGEEAGEKAKRLYDIYDDDNLETSYDSAEVEKLDTELRGLINAEEMKKNGGEFIKKNAGAFVK